MIEIREASSEQFDEIWPIFEDVAKDADSYPYLPNISKNEAKAQWFAPDAKVFIAYAEGKPIATRYIIPNKTGLGNHVCNMGVMIDKNYRGRGIGRIMMEFGITKAKELGFSRLLKNLPEAQVFGGHTAMCRWFCGVIPKTPGQSGVV